MLTFHSVLEKEHLSYYPSESMDKDGLEVADIQVQASALYFRWLQPLLAFYQPTIDSHLVSYLLSYHLPSINQRQHHQILFLFPCSRYYGFRKLRTGTLDMLYTAIDYIPHSNDAVKISPATAMVLSLQTAFYIPPSSSFYVLARAKKKCYSLMFINITLTKTSYTGKIRVFPLSCPRNVPQKQQSRVQLQVVSNSNYALSQYVVLLFWKYNPYYFNRL